MPFLQYSIQEVGNHLPYCKQRDGRDYSQYLAPKTLKKRSQSPKKAKCPKCDKYFMRLDTHLRISASCRSIPPPSPHPIYSTLMPCATPSQGYLHQPTSEAAMFFTPHNSNFTASANETTDNIPCKPKVKGHLLLPKTTEGWKEANDYLENTLVPAVMAAPTPQMKHDILIKGIYSYFSSACGTRPLQKVHIRKKRDLSTMHH